MPQTSRQPRAPSRGLWRLRACPPRDLEDFARKAGHGRSRSQQPVTNVTKVASKRDQNEIDYILKCQAEAAHLLLELYTLYLFQLHIWSYLQVLAGLYSLDWAWWCDDMWCFSCKFIAIAVNSCALACIAIMAMLEESTSQPRFWPYREPMLQVLSKRIKERKKRDTDDIISNVSIFEKMLERKVSEVCEVQKIGRVWSSHFAAEHP